MATEPAWLRAAPAKLGTGEAPGIAYNADSVPWCGVFVAACLAEDGIEAAPIAMRAKAWATWDQSVQPERIALGTVLVFERPGGGHVGFYVGEDRTH